MGPAVRPVFKPRQAALNGRRLDEKKPSNRDDERERKNLHTELIRRKRGSSSSRHSSSRTQAGSSQEAGAVLNLKRVIFDK